MSTMTKVFIVLTSILSIALSALFIAAVAQMSNWKEVAERYQTLSASAVQSRMNESVVAEAALAMKDQALLQARQELETTQRQQQDLANQLADAQNELARRTNESVAAEAGRNKLQEILGVQTAELTSLRQQNQELLNQTMDLQTRNSRLNSRVLELTSNNTIMNDQIRSLQERIYGYEQQLQDCQQQLAGGGTRRAAPQQQPPGVTAGSPTVAGPIRGEIASIDGNYASINVGESSGVVEGMTFIVHRGADFVAELVVDSVRPNEAAGKLRMISQPVQRGDAVTYGLEGAGGR